MSDSLVVNSNSFVISMPDNGPALGFDPMAETFDWTDVLPDNFFSMENLEERAKNMGGWPLYRPQRVELMPVYDPMDDEDKRDMSPKLVMYFAEIPQGPGLVLNKSRCQMISEMSGTRNPRLWAEKLGPVVLECGLYNKKAQIVLTSPMPANEPVPEPVHDDSDIHF